MKRPTWGRILYLPAKWLWNFNFLPIYLQVLQFLKIPVLQAMENFFCMAIKKKKYAIFSDLEKVSW